MFIMKKKKFICFVGKNGIGSKKREGDLITPKGKFKLVKLFYKKKELNKIKTRIPKTEIKKILLGAQIQTIKNTTL